MAGRHRREALGSTGSSPAGRDALVEHLFEQGFAGAFWLGVLLAFGLRFVLRWRADYQSYDAQGNRRKAWRIAFGKRGWSERTIWDSRRAQWVHASVLALPVTHPDSGDTPLWRVVCRSKGRTPCYLLTAEPITTAEDAWRVVFLHLLAPRYESLRLWLLRTFCHRTGWHLRRVKLPLYRLRAALSRLWQRYPPCFAALGRPRREQGLGALT